MRKQRAENMDPVAGLAKSRAAKRYRRRRLAAVLLFCAVVLAFAFSFSAFFYIDAIEVTGDIAIYTKQEIIGASDVKKGTNIFHFSAARAESRIMSSLTYVQGVTIRRSLPNKVIIQVQEASNALVLPHKNGALILTQNLSIVENADSYTGKAIYIYGVQPESYRAGNALSDEQPEHIESLQIILEKLQEQDLLGSVSAVFVQDKLNLALVVEDRLFVMLGTSGNLSRKTRMLAEMLQNQLGAEEKGQLDLSVAGRATFTPQDTLDLAGWTVLPEK